MTDVAPGPYEHTGAYSPANDLTRRYMIAAREAHAEAVRLAAENRDLRARLETYRVAEEARSK